MNVARPDFTACRTEARELPQRSEKRIWSEGSSCCLWSYLFIYKVVVVGKEMLFLWKSMNSFLDSMT